VQADAALGGVGGEIGSNVVDGEGHDGSPINS
jgi:hypothetical protein